MSEKIKAKIQYPSSGEKYTAAPSHQSPVSATNTVELSNTIEKSINIDSTDLSNGSVLVYKALTSKWKATTHLNQQNVDGGEF